MKNTLWPLLSLLFVATSLLGQTPGKGPAIQTSPASSMTSHEADFRAYFEFLRGDVKKNRTQIVDQFMQLAGEDAAKFWPIYSEFESEYSEFGYGVLTLILNYAANYNDMTPLVADQLASKLLDLEQERNDTKRKYYQKLKTALNPITAAKFLQVENQIERILDLQISSQLPAIDAPPGRHPGDAKVPAGTRMDFQLLTDWRTQ
jgi:hypothetical protein